LRKTELRCDIFDLHFTLIAKRCEASPVGTVYVQQWRGLSVKKVDCILKTLYGPHKLAH